MQDGSRKYIIKAVAWLWVSKVSIPVFCKHWPSTFKSIWVSYMENLWAKSFRFWSICIILKSYIEEYRHQSKHRIHFQQMNHIFTPWKKVHIIIFFTIYWMKGFVHKNCRLSLGHHGGTTHFWYWNILDWNLMGFCVCMCVCVCICVCRTGDFSVPLNQLTFLSSIPLCNYYSSFRVSFEAS
jgi:hypothetical protein